MPVAELSVVLGISSGQLRKNDLFAEEDDDFIFLPAEVSIFARGNLPGILGYFGQTIATYSLDEFASIIINVLELYRNFQEFR